MAERLTKTDELLLLNDREGYLKHMLKRIRYIRTYAQRTLTSLNAMDAQWPDINKEERDEMRRHNDEIIKWADAQEEHYVTELKEFESDSGG